MQSDNIGYGEQFGTRYKMVVSKFDLFLKRVPVFYSKSKNVAQIRTKLIFFNQFNDCYKLSKFYAKMIN